VILLTKNKEETEKNNSMMHCKSVMSAVPIIIILILIISIINSFMIFGVASSLSGVQSTLSESNAQLGNMVDSGENAALKPIIKESEAARPTVQVDLADDDALKGNPDAKVTIVEFSYFECPYCERFYSGAYPEIIEKYVDTGKVNFVYRDYPLNFHKDAQKAAEAAECAGEQGNYYAMHDKLFENQSAMGVASLKQYAAEIGLDTTKFNTCLDSGAMASEVQADFAAGQALGVSGTPSFYINGTKLVGSQPFSEFERVIEAELAK
jgi:protein-disulfide isomerase